MYQQVTLRILPDPVRLVFGFGIFAPGFQPNSTKKPRWTLAVSGVIPFAARLDIADKDYEPPDRFGNAPTASCRLVCDVSPVIVAQRTSSFSNILDRLDCRLRELQKPFFPVSTKSPIQLIDPEVWPLPRSVAIADHDKMIAVSVERYESGS